MSMLERFRAPKHLELRDKDAGDTPLRDDKKGKLKNGEIKERERVLTAELTAEVAKLQEKLYAARDQKLLLILQGMDTSGKDGTVRALFSQINPMGLHATGFVAPTEKEKAHDFLWRVHARVPAKGEIGIFNRSHYEDVLVPRILGTLDGKDLDRRYAQIRDFERMLAETGTTVMKVFLHISKDEQRERLQARLDDPEKHWKFDPADLTAREKWDVYQDAYADAINATDGDHAPWYIVPADSKTHRNLIIAHLMLETMQGMKLEWPEPKADMAKVRIDN
ncbi:polyphosphate kinase 2 family protein [Telluria mixta]|uniref:Polyphosphate kinase 2 family protein n=1 Tax=Telluria mixta TaxID=34071 RepID=A0ABT2C5R3_9BURK|nr:PPK2 family polyphosphate kinase [Telluria mixta]MCS0632728.1 polyphosphate kinase 2 family protein [Telluria mixta]WEM97804.1 polyphosphate kinase 2 family protein [Telluria mixta]